MAQPFLTAEWRYLLMLNFEVSPQLVQPLVPRGTELDFWNGKTFLSVVGFRFLNTRLLGCTFPFHVNFDEINLRLYVRRRAGSLWRRGVVFIKEIVARWAVAMVANRVYNENYVVCPMRHQLRVPDGQSDGMGSVEYCWKGASRWTQLAAEFGGKPLLPKSGSEEEFITEHYWGYTRQRDGSTMEYQVAHPPWRVWAAQKCCFECPVAEFYGLQFAAVLSARPTSAFVAEGSAIDVFRGERIK
jgi:uncharacterized protein YqjF (DUF2071 family)